MKTQCSSQHIYYSLTHYLWVINKNMYNKKKMFTLFINYLSLLLIYHCSQFLSQIFPPFFFTWSALSTPNNNLFYCWQIAKQETSFMVQSFCFLKTLMCPFFTSKQFLSHYAVATNSLFLKVFMVSMVL